MNKESVGKLFKGNFGTYECVAYSDKPSVVMKNTITDESICVVIDSDYAKTFKLIEEDKKIKKIDRTKPFSTFDVADKVDEIVDIINEMREDK